MTTNTSWRAALAGFVLLSPLVATGEASGQHPYDPYREGYERGGVEARPNQYKHLRPVPPMGGWRGRQFERGRSNGNAFMQRYCSTYRC